MKRALKENESKRRLNIDQKMIGILSIFAILGLCLIFIILIATNSLSALRAYSTLQTHWTEARKEATFQLVNYLKTKDPVYLTRFDSTLHMIHKTTEVRHELFKPDTDHNYVRKRLLVAHTMPEDVENMIITFERFHTFPDFKEAINQWIESDRLVYEMEAMIPEMRKQIAANSFNTIQQRKVSEVLNLDRNLTLVQYKLAAALTAGTGFLNSIILWVSSSLGIILLLTGGLFSFRFLKSVKNWRRTIEISEQQYRSLFEQNRNAAYSFSKKGGFISGNEILEEMIGYSIEELRGKTFDSLIKESELQTVKKHFEKALQGIPQRYETVGIHKSGKEIYIEVTNLPIFVDDEIIGVYGIAHDISIRKSAERKIIEQLEEKTHLLTEIHDRVKNNLAIISSLVQLQQERLGSEAREYLDGTVSRIHSMAMVHERLYHTETFSSIRMDEYVNELGATIRNTYESDSKEIRFVAHTDPVTLSINKAIPAGLLMNELLNNAFKFAFSDQDKGVVEVGLHQQNDEVTIKVADDGKGLPEDFDLETTKTLGIKLINVLVRQLNADLDIETDDGTTFTIRFNV